MRSGLNGKLRKAAGLAAGLTAMILLMVSGSGCGDGKGKGEAADSLNVAAEPLQREIDSLSKLIHYSKDNWELHYQRSLLYYHQGKMDLAMTDIDKSLEIAKDNPELYHMKGFYHYVQNKDEVALEYFKLSAHYGSENPETFYQLGEIHFLRKNYEEADKYYNTAIELDSLDPQYVFAKGYLQQMQGNTDKAVAFYEAALEMDAGHIKSLNALYEVYLNDKKDLKTAMEYNARILAVDSLDPVGNFNQGNFYLDQAMAITDTSKFDEFNFLLKLSIVHYTRTLMRNPNSASALYARGYAYYMMDMYNDALKDFDAVLEVDPYHEKAWFLRGCIYEYYGDLKMALESFDKALELAPEWEDAKVAVEEVGVKLKAS